MEELIYKRYKLTVKASDPSGTFTGVASTTARDTDDEIVDRGAFTRTLQASGGKFPLLWQHDITKPTGWSKSAVEDDRGLQLEGVLLMNSEQGRWAHDFISTGLSVGGRPGLSIGFIVPKGGDYIGTDGYRHFKEIILKEVSIVTFPANVEAIVTGSKGATSFGDLPLASGDMSWDAGSARSALAKWAGGPDKDNINWAKYRRGFFWFDSSAPNEVGSYKLPFATIVDGKLMAVPRGVMAAAGGHGVDSADIPSSDKAKVKSVISRYYKKMKKDSPFKGESLGGGSMATTSEIGFKAADFETQLSQNQQLGDHYDTKWKMDRALSEAIDNIKDDEDMALSDKKPLIHKCLDQHCEAMKSWWSRLLDITQPDDADNEDDDTDPDNEDKGKKKPLPNYDDERSMTVGQRMDAVIHFMKGEALSAKEGRSISRATKALIDKCMGHIKDAHGHAAAAMEAHTKGLGVLSDLSVGRYFNDVNVENPVGGSSSGGGVKPTTNAVGGGPKAEDLNDLMNVLKGVQNTLQVNRK